MYRSRIPIETARRGVLQIFVLMGLAAAGLMIGATTAAFASTTERVTDRASPAERADVRKNHATQIAQAAPAHRKRAERRHNKRKRVERRHNKRRQIARKHRRQRLADASPRQRRRAIRNAPPRVKRRIIQRRNNRGGGS